MPLAPTQSEPVALVARAGKKLAITIIVTDETELGDEELQLLSYRGRLQIRDLRGRQRVLIDTLESTDNTAPLQRLGPGRWLIMLGKSYTAWLPYKSAFELEFENIYVPDDVVPAVTGTINIIPESTVNTA